MVFSKKEKYVPARNLTRIWSESLSISAQELAMIRSSSSWVEGNSNLFLVFHQEVSNHSVYNVYSEQNLSKKSQQILDQHDKLKNVFNLDWCALNIKIQNKEHTPSKHSEPMIDFDKVTKLIKDFMFPWVLFPHIFQTYADILSYRTRQTFRICILTATQNWLHGQTRAASWSILGCILKVERGIHRAKPKWRTDFSMIDFSACGWSMGYPQNIVLVG